VFEIISDVSGCAEKVHELPEVESNERTVHQKVLEAHRILMSMNETNEETFKDLVYTLESENKH
jgi:hypothetical protein